MKKLEGTCMYNEWMTIGGKGDACTMNDWSLGGKMGKKSYNAFELQVQAHIESWVRSIHYWE